MNNHVRYLQYQKDRFEIIKYLVLRYCHGTLKEESRHCNIMFGRSYQTCKKIVKWCIRKGYFKVRAVPYGKGMYVQIKTISYDKNQV